MRETFIGVFGGVVLIVSVLSFALMKLTIGDVSNKGEAQLVVNAASPAIERSSSAPATRAASRAAAAFSALCSPGTSRRTSAPLQRKRDPCGSSDL